MRIPKYYYYPTLPPYEPPPTLPKRIGTQLNKYKPSRLPLGRIILTLVLGGCWWLGSVPVEDESPAIAATPARYEDASPELRAQLNGIDRGAASIRKTFTTGQIEELRKEFQVAYRQRNKAMQDAYLGGKLLVNGQKTSQADAITHDIDENTLTAFQRKYRLSFDEMSAFTSGRVP